MSLKQLVAYTPASFLFIDPSIENLGYCIYRASTVSKQLKLDILEYGVHTPVDAGPEDDLAIRCRSQYRFVSAMEKKHSPYRIYIEVPPMTIYDQKGLSVNELVGKAQNVAKLFAVVYSIFGHLADTGKCLPILPSQWQQSRSQKMKSKEWSLQFANIVLLKSGITKSLSTKRDENAADAISMGSIILTKLFNS